MVKLSVKVVALLLFSFLFFVAVGLPAKPASADGGGSVSVGYNPDHPGYIEFKATGIYQMADNGAPNWTWGIQIDGTGVAGSGSYAALGSYVPVAIDEFIYVGSGTHTFRFVGLQNNPPDPIQPFWWHLEGTITVP